MSKPETKKKILKAAIKKKKKERRAQKKNKDDWITPGTDFTNSKLVRGKKIKSRAEKNDSETKNTIQKTNKTKAGVLEKIKSKQI